MGSHRTLRPFKYCFIIFMAIQITGPNSDDIHMRDHSAHRLVLSTWISHLSGNWILTNQLCVKQYSGYCNTMQPDTQVCLKKHKIRFLKNVTVKFAIIIKELCSSESLSEQSSVLIF